MCTLVFMFYSKSWFFCSIVGNPASGSGRINGQGMRALVCFKINGDIIFFFSKNSLNIPSIESVLN